MRLIISFVFFIAFLASTIEIYASTNIFSESESLGSATEEKKTDEFSLWEESERSFSEGGSSFFDKSDDWKLYAPPPGEEGNPQKIAPLGGSDLYFLLSAGLVFGLTGCVRRRKRIAGA
jgi:hypothetical protein